MKEPTLRQIDYILTATRYDTRPIAYEEVSSWSFQKAWDWIADRQKQWELKKGGEQNDSNKK